MPKVTRSQPSELTPLFLTVDEFCHVMRTSRPTAYNGMKRGIIPYIDDGGRRKIPTSYARSREKAALASIKREASA